MRMSPALVVSVTSEMPTPSERLRVSGARSRSTSHPPSRSALGLIRSAVTLIPVTLASTWSSAAASSARHGVIRVQARSVLPGS